MLTDNTNRNARWSVMWVAKGKIHEKKVGTDFTEALRLYGMLIRGGRKAPTLRCTNVGFAPPPKTRKLMRAYNLKGAWWCPYCIKLRKFTKIKGYRLDGVWVDDVHFSCPMCKISHRDSHVHRHNPLAQTLAYRKRTRGKRTNGRRRKRA